MLNLSQHQNGSKEIFSQSFLHELNTLQLFKVLTLSDLNLRPEMKSFIKNSSLRTIKTTGV